MTGNVSGKVWVFDEEHGNLSYRLEKIVSFELPGELGDSAVTSSGTRMQYNSRMKIGDMIATDIIDGVE